MQVRWCVDCQGETFFEVPPCEDGHGSDCLDLACLDCGAALVLGVHSTDTDTDTDLVLAARAA